jgi:succinylarginine dihydrolase
LWQVVGRWLSPVSSTNKTDSHDIIEALLKVALNTIANQYLFSSQLFINREEGVMICILKEMVLYFQTICSYLPSLYWKAFSM